MLRSIHERSMVALIDMLQYIHRILTLQCTVYYLLWLKIAMTDNRTPREQSVMAQFRLGTLPLEMELGRLLNKKIQERNDIEDETHLL